MASQHPGMIHWNPRLIEAAMALNDNQLEVAERILKPYLKEDPFDVRAIRMLAELAARIGRWREPAAGACLAELRSYAQDCRTPGRRDRRLPAGDRVAADPGRSLVEPREFEDGEVRPEGRQGNAGRSGRARSWRR